jgi:enoyl-CoA hydratase/carnithine racemase
MNAEDAITFERRDRVAWFGLSRSEKHNAINNALHLLLRVLSSPRSGHTLSQ